MTKWIFLLFVVALVWSGWWASQEDAAEWAPAAPTLVLAAGVVSGLVYAIRYGLRRRNEMADVAARAGMEFAKNIPKDTFRELGLGALKLFVYCRPVEELEFLQRSVHAHFSNVMTSRTGDAELYVFDFSTSTGNGGPDQRGTFACIRTPGAELPDLEIVPRLWGARPEWLKGLTDSRPTRTTFETGAPAFDAEYRTDSADEPAARSVVSDELVRFLSNPDETGWRVEMSGQWMAVTRLAPTRTIGSINDPMTPEAVPRDERRSYFEHPIAPEHVPRLIEVARRLSPHRGRGRRAKLVG